MQKLRIKVEDQEVIEANEKYQLKKIVHFLYAHSNP